MSTKIYAGMRVRTSDLPEFFVLFRKAATKHVADLLVSIAEPTGKGLDVLKASVGKLLDDSQFHKDMTDKLEERDWRLLYLLQIAKEASASPRNSVLCVDISLNVFPAGEDTLLIPYCPRSFKAVEAVQAELESEPHNLGRTIVWHYGYWDNADPDKDVSEEEWAERADAWGRVLADDGWDSRRMEHIVFELKDCDRTFRDVNRLFRAIYGDDKDKALHMTILSADMDGKVMQAENAARRGLSVVGKEM